MSLRVGSVDRWSTLGDDGQRHHSKIRLPTSAARCQAVSGRWASVWLQTPQPHRRMGPLLPATLRGHDEIIRCRNSSFARDQSFSRALISQRPIVSENPKAFHPRQPQSTPDVRLIPWSLETHGRACPDRVTKRTRCETKRRCVVRERGCQRFDVAASSPRQPVRCLFVMRPGRRREPRSLQLSIGLSAETARRC